MFSIFRDELDTAFRVDGKLHWKLLGGAVVGAGIGLKFWAEFRNEPKLSGIIATACLIGAPAVITVVAVLFLSLKDVVKIRIAEGQPVSFLLRLYLASGMVSLVLWIVTGIVGTFLAAIVLNACRLLP